MNTRKKQAHVVTIQKKTLLMKFGEKAKSFGEKLTALRNYFKKAAINVISIIKNAVQQKNNEAVEKPIAKKPLKKKPVTSVAHKKRTVAAKKKVARVNDANDINIYA